MNFKDRAGYAAKAITSAFNPKVKYLTFIRILHDGNKRIFYARNNEEATEALGILMCGPALSQCQTQEELHQYLANLNTFIEDTWLAEQAKKQGEI